MHAPSPHPCLPPSSPNALHRCVVVLGMPYADPYNPALSPLLNALCRCVVVLGMPYADPSDPELRERMAFLDRQGTSFTGVNSVGGWEAVAPSAEAKLGKAVCEE